MLTVEEIRALRLAGGHTQRELSIAAGLAARHVQWLEDGRARLTADLSALLRRTLAKMPPPSRDTPLSGPRQKKRRPAQRVDLAALEAANVSMSAKLALVEFCVNEVVKAYRDTGVGAMKRRSDAVYRLAAVMAREPAECEEDT